MPNHFQIKKTCVDIVNVSVRLFKIMIPTLILVKILEEMGVVFILNKFMAPLTTLMGLPFRNGDCAHYYDANKPLCWLDCVFQFANW